MSFARKAHGLLAITVFGAALSTMSSCVEAEGMLYVTKAVSAGAGAADAEVPDACGGAFNSIIHVNVGFIFRTDGTPLYDRSLAGAGAFVCVASKLKSRIDNGVETSNVLLYEYDVSLDGGATQTQPFSGFVVAASADANPQDSGGEASMYIDLVPPSTLASVASSLGQGEAREFVAGVKVYGRTTGGLEVETNEFFIPTDIYRVDEFCKCDADSALGEVPCEETDPGCL